MNPSSMKAPAEDTLRVEGFDRLSAGNATYFREWTASRILPTHRFLDVDCSATMFIDSEGIAALVYLRKRLAAQEGTVRLCNPSPFIQSLLQLLRLDSAFPILRS